MAERFIREIIVPARTELMKLTEACSVILRVVQYYYDGWNPGLGLSSEYTRVLGDIRASLDIDLYCIGE
ncbi:MAG: DUF4279 domain-containing protein [bacterium]|nr:DUF4279 domain-containing protein [bacterium]